MGSRRQITLVLAAVATAALIGGTVTGALDGAIYLLPALLLLLPLLRGQYVGETRLEQLRTRHQLSKSPSTSRLRQLPYVLRSRDLVPRGGELIGRALAVRPPPLAAVS